LHLTSNQFPTSHGKSHTYFPPNFRNARTSPGAGHFLDIHPGEGPVDGFPFRAAAGKQGHVRVHASNRPRPTGLSENVGSILPEEPTIKRLTVGPPGT
jgi:hypothetical protein